MRAVAPETAAPFESCTVIIFGATGDLTRRKLIPALFSLRCFGAADIDKRQPSVKHRGMTTASNARGESHAHG